MAGVLPVSFVLGKKPQGLGYTILEACRENPYYEVGESLRGHEFHYSKAVLEYSDKAKTVFKVLRGRGLDGRRDGLCRKNLLAMYTHVHAGGNRRWAKNFVARAEQYRKSKDPGPGSGEHDYANGIDKIRNPNFDAFVKSPTPSLRGAKRRGNLIGFLDE
jgi:cobyrinic acid a,c-diamide synthase